MPGIFMSSKSKISVLEKFKELNIHKRRIPIEALAKDLRPIIQGVMNYYCKYSANQSRDIWNQLNARLLKWEKELYKMASLRWLRNKYKELPLLFPHCQQLNP